MNYSRKMWTEEEQQYVKENYRTMDAKDIATYLGRSKASVIHYADRHGLVAKGIWLKEEDDYLREHYDNMTYREIGKILGRSKASIDNRMIALGLEKSKYTYDHYYFHVIDTPEKAYWCGFIMADGSVRYNPDDGGQMTIKLKASDDDHLKKFNKAIGGNLPITYITRDTFHNGHYNTSCSIVLNSVQIVKDLEYYNVIPNKTLIKQFPTNISNELMLHYIRGYFDGNGSVGITGKNRIFASFCTGSRDFANGLYNYINDKMNIKTGGVIHTDGTNYYQINILYKYILSFLHMIYDNAPIYLDRKYDRYQQILKKDELLRQLEIAG